MVASVLWQLSIKAAVNIRVQVLVWTRIPHTCARSTCPFSLGARDRPCVLFFVLFASLYSCLWMYRLSTHLKKNQTVPDWYSWGYILYPVFVLGVPHSSHTLTPPTLSSWFDCPIISLFVGQMRCLLFQDWTCCLHLYRLAKCGVCPFWIPLLRFTHQLPLMLGKHFNILILHSHWKALKYRF